jgi:thiol-disulfide isomerase/thioredoxin
MREVRPATVLLSIILALPVTGSGHRAGPEGQWRAALDLAGGELRFSIRVAQTSNGYQSWLCNGDLCDEIAATRVLGDSLLFEISDYAATIAAALHGDSLTGEYRNVGSRGPRRIPFRAARGQWEAQPAPPRLIGRWDAWFSSDWQTTPRVFEIRNGPLGLGGTIISNSGDYGLFWGQATGDSFSLGHFDGSFVYLVTGRLEGDTLRGIFHAGLRNQTPWVAVRSTGRPHLTPPTAVVQADTTAPFAFSFPDLSGNLVSNTDPRFRNKVVLVDIFGTWCPTCHDSAPELVSLYQRYHDRGLEVVGLAYEVTGDSAVDAGLVRRYRDKYRMPFPLLLAGRNDQDEVQATLPQLSGAIAFPTTIFIGRNGLVRRVHAGFYGPATGAQHEHLIEEFRKEIELLLGEP